MNYTEDIARGAKHSNAAGTGALDSGNKIFVFKRILPPGVMLIASSLMHWEMLANCLDKVSHAVDLLENEEECRLFYLFLGSLFFNIAEALTYER